MSLLRRAVIGAATLTLASPLLAQTPAAHATIPFAQQLKLRNDPTNSVGVTRHYTSFVDGYDDCSWQGGGGQDPHEKCYATIGSGDITVTPITYRLDDESKTKDYFLVDLTVKVSNIKGNKDYAFLDAQLKQTSDVLSATGSSGYKEVSACKKYPLTLELGWGPFAAGTEVGQFSVNCHRTYITKQAVTHGSRYHVTNLNAVNYVNFQRFVVVKAGKTPTFRWDVRYPTDKCFETTVGTASGSQPYKECKNHTKTIGAVIGTTG